MRSQREEERARRVRLTGIQGEVSQQKERRAGSNRVTREVFDHIPKRRYRGRTVATPELRTRREVGGVARECRHGHAAELSCRVWPAAELAQHRAIRETIGTSEWCCCGGRCKGVECVDSATNRGGTARDDELLVALRMEHLEEVVRGLDWLAARGIRYPIPPYGVQSDPTAAFEVNYAGKM